jgi:hypothetical protein
VGVAHRARTVAAVTEGQLVLRRRGSAEVADLAVAVLRADAGSYARAYAPWAALAVGGAALLWSWDEGVALLWVLLVARIGHAPVTLAVSERVAGRSARVAFGAGLRAAGRLLLGWMLWGVPALVALIIPPLGLYLWLRGLYAPEVDVVERPTTGSFARINALATAAGSSIVTTRCWLLAVEAWAWLGGEAVGQAVVEGLLQLGTPWGTLWDGHVTPYQLAGIVLVQPLLALMRFCAWLDVRTRTEALDAWFLVWAASSRNRGGAA